MTAITDALARLRAAVNDKLWVNPEYAEEFAVLSAWLSLLIPWSLTYGRLGSGGDAPLIFQMRFPFVLVQYAPNVPLVEAFQLRYAHELMQLESGSNAGLATGFEFWFVGSLLLALAFVLSLVMYVELGVLDRFRSIAPVRAMGGLLLLAALAMTVSDYYLWHNMPGRQIPVFTLFYYVFAVALLSIEDV